MKSRHFLSQVLIAVVLLTTLFVAQRALWEASASNLVQLEKATLSDRNATPDETTEQLRKETHTAKLLSNTCFYVAECTWSQYASARSLARANETRLESYVSYVKIQQNAMTLYKRLLDQAAANNINKDDVLAFQAIADPYRQAKAEAIKNREISAHLFDADNLPKKLELAFKLLR